MSAFERLRMMITMMKMRARGIRMVKCHAALERVFEYLDGELDAGTAAQVGAHFDICKECYPRYQYEKSFLERLRGIQQDESAPQELRERVLTLIREEG